MELGGVVELWKKIILQWQPMELGGLPQKKTTIFIGDLYSMYVVLQWNWVSGDLYSMYVVLRIMYKSLWGVATLGPYKGIHYIRNSLWGVATWMSEVPQLEHFNKKNRSPEMI